MECNWRCFAKEQVMPDPSRHSDSRNALESLLRKIPGFKGYVEKEYRRDSDDLARALIAGELQKSKSSLDRFQRGLVDAGRLETLPRCDSIRARLNLQQARIQGAMRGYSGFFDFVRVDEELLDQVYQHDLMLVDDARQLVTMIDSLSSNAGDAEAMLVQVEQRLVAISNHLDERTKLLEGLN
jgi:hypothetical protein